MKNIDVVKAWVRGDYAKSGHMKTDSYNLWSYNLLIGTVKNGRRVVFDYTSRGGHFYSVTTSKHVGLAARHANLVAPE